MTSSAQAMVTGTTTSHLHTRRHSRPSTTPAARPPNYQPGSVGNNMPPLLSARTPYKSTTKAPSPNYFGTQQPSDNDAFLPRFSPPSSTVRSTAAASPSVLPLDQNPEFDAFRKQSDRNALKLGGLNDNPSKSATVPRSSHVRGASRTEIVKGEMELAQSQSLDPAAAELGRSPKRVLSPGSLILPEQERRASPASFESAARRSHDVGFDAQPRLSLPLDKSHGPAGFPTATRADTLPTKNDGDSPLMVTPQHVVNLIESKVEQVLLLDLRVSTQYAAAHIDGALNLCIPTTLLKRPSFNIKKLTETFQDEEHKRKFLQWKHTTYIIVYDASSALMKDAQICVNTIKKFRTEGYEGTLYIVKGGFADFAKRFPAYVGDGANSMSRTSSIGIDSDGPQVAPVVGGCPMPTTDQPANPFFGTIRQNMDLIGGVGQIPLQHPAKATKSAEKEFPEWLRQASGEQDQGKKVSDRFEAIEKREKKRMEEALSGKVTWANSCNTPRRQQPDDSTKVAGIEKGAKNRYNNIFPYEHSRVKLQGVPSHGCDYFNGSWVRAGWSNKQYISTQAPVPATFSDFWNVVWQQDVRVVVMLTAEKEGPQIKSHNYWDQKQYGPFRLDYLSEKRASIDPSRIHRHRQRPPMSKRSSTGPQLPHTQLDSKEAKTGDQPHVVVRRFTLSHDKHPFDPMREITQLQYSSWPDFGAPAHPAHLLGLVEQCNAVVRTANKAHSTSDPEPPSKRPVLVHCSAGCGRTGTFCTVDSVIDMIKRQRISRRQRRQASPMDVDSPARRQGQAEGGGGFFASQQSTSRDRADGGDDVEGKWLLSDDRDLVEKTVEDFRTQRLSMVQSLRQYVLCYESIMEWLVQEHGEGR